MSCCGEVDRLVAELARVQSDSIGEHYDRAGLEVARDLAREEVARLRAVLGDIGAGRVPLDVTAAQFARAALEDQGVDASQRPATGSRSAQGAGSVPAAGSALDGHGGADGREAS